MRNKKSEIVFLHGYRGAPIGVAEIADELRKKGYVVHTPAVPPFADAGLMTEYSPESYAEFVKNYITEHKLEKPILIGHSMGSVVAAITASRYPDLTNNKLVLLSPISKRTPRVLSVLSMAAAYLPRTLVDYVTTKVLYVGKDRAELKKILQVTHDCTGVTHAPRKDLARAGRFSADYGILELDFTKNTLLLAGAKDRLVKQKDTKKLAEKLGAELIFLDGTGHIHNYEKPRETAVEIIKFLEK